MDTNATTPAPIALAEWWESDFRRVAAIHRLPGLIKDGVYYPAGEEDFAQALTFREELNTIEVRISLPQKRLPEFQLIATGLDVELATRWRLFGRVGVSIKGAASSVQWAEKFSK